MKEYIHLFKLVRGNSYEKLSKINKFFDNWQYAWEKSKYLEFKKAGLDEDFIKAILEARKWDKSKLLDDLWSKDIFLIDQKSEEYNQNFKNISKPPFLIYRKGENLKNFTNNIAIVGMRKASIQGEKLTYDISKKLSDYEFTIISGLAFGIDAAAHQGAIKGKGKTVGILASGIDRITPTAHNSLAENILINGGSIISEYPPGSLVGKHHFIERNRLIAAMSHTTIIVEADQKSGSLITASFALEQGKEVLAFPADPGRIQGRGCNKLIKKGEAQLIDCFADIEQSIRDRNLWGKERKPVNLTILDDFEQNIVREIANHKYSTNDLLNIFENKEKVYEVLSKLEIEGIIIRNSSLLWQKTID